MSDCSETLQNSVEQALDQKKIIDIQGGGSKQFYIANNKGSPLSTIAHHGVINYEPKELVITARCGTSLQELKSLLAKEGQMLAFEPPHFSENATIGGTIACGFSGPRRPYSGSARDFVLGTRIINGQAEILHFGGEVMKNVAGYDVSRLMVGALGTLGLILEVSLKVLPLPEHEASLTLECQVDDAIRMMNEWSGSPLAISAACYDGAQLSVRLSGAAAAVTAGSKRIGGEEIQDAEAYWENVRELQHGFFNNEKNLWRLSVPSETPHIDLAGKQFIDWGGAQRWFIADSDETPSLQKTLQQNIENQGGHVTLFRSGSTHSDDAEAIQRFHPLEPAMLALHTHLKHSFDPQGIFNPGRLYRDI